MEMGKMLVFMIMLVTFAASTIAYDGSATTVVEGEVIGAFCTMYYPDAKLVEAKPEIWNSGESCGQLVYITCSDAQCGSPRTGTWGVIANLCDSCKTSFKLTKDAWDIIAPGAASIIQIEYTYG